MKVDDNLHRDIDKRAQVTECIAGWIASLPLVDSIEDVHRWGMIHRRDQTQDAPFCVDDQLYLCTEDTSQSPKKIIINNNLKLNIKYKILHHKWCSDISSQRDSCSYCRCKRIYLVLDCGARKACTWLKIVLVSAMRIRSACHEPVSRRRLARP
jgi:hypothetical protein